MITEHPEDDMSRPERLEYFKAMGRKLEEEAAAKEGTKSNPVPCDTWSDAFAICREADRPMWVLVGDLEDLARVYPSGKAEEPLPEIAPELPPDDEHRRLSKPEPAPAPNDSRPIWELVVEDMRARDQVGREKYGTPLQANNGRNPLIDAYQEALDLAVYLRQAHTDPVDWRAVAASACQQLRRLPYSVSLDDIFRELECAGNVEEFDASWSDLYDWADDSKRLWIDTTGTANR